MANFSTVSADEWSLSEATVSPCSPQFLQYDRGRDDSELLAGSVTLRSSSGFDRVLQRMLIVGCGVSD